MKILHLSTGFPLSFQGGITNYVRMLATVQKKMDMMYGLWEEKMNKNMSLNTFNTNLNI